MLIVGKLLIKSGRPLPPPIEHVPDTKYSFSRKVKLLEFLKLLLYAFLPELAIVIYWFFESEVNNHFVVSLFVFTFFWRMFYFYDPNKTIASLICTSFFVSFLENFIMFFIRVIFVMLSMTIFVHH